MANYSENLIPVMTDYTIDSVVVSCSSYNGSSYSYKAFDKNINTFWYSNTSKSGWLKVDFGLGNEQSICKYSILSSFIGYEPKSWTFEGSNDDLNWVVLDIKSNYTTWGINTQNFIFNNTDKYRYYRINITDTSIYAPLIYELEMMSKIAEVQYLIKDKNNNLYKYDGENIVVIGDNSLTETNFITNGISDITAIPQANWLSTFPDISQVKILMWTDDTTKTEAKLVYNCDQFNLIQWLKYNECKLLVWTDDITKTECSMVYNCDPYVIWNMVRQGAKVLQYDGTDITVVQTKNGQLFLLQDGLKEKFINNSLLTVLNDTPYTNDEFFDHGMKNLIDITPTIVNNMENNKYKFSMMKNG